MLGVMIDVVFNLGKVSLKPEEEEQQLQQQQQQQQWWYRKEELYNGESDI